MDVDKASKMYKSMPPNRRLMYGVGLFAFAAMGLYYAGKLEKWMPAKKGSETVADWKRQSENQVKKELDNKK